MCPFFSSDLSSLNQNLITLCQTPRVSGKTDCSSPGLLRLTARATHSLSTALIRPGMGQEGDGGGGWASEATLGTAAVVSHPPTPKHAPRPSRSTLKSHTWVGWGRTVGWAGKTSPQNPSRQFFSERPSLTLPNILSSERLCRRL